ncbi:19260_t:CDS:1, partial [Gigaspora rosea]
NRSLDCSLLIIFNNIVTYFSLLIITLVFFFLFMDNSQNDDFMSFSPPNLSPQHDNFNEDLDSGKTSDSLDNLSSEEESDKTIF